MEKVDKTEKKGWLSIVFSYTEGRRGKLALSVLLSVVSIVAGILPYFCLYRVIEAFVNGTSQRLRQQDGEAPRIYRDTAFAISTDCI